MARDVRAWVAATLIVCGIVAVVYLPPRGDRADRYRRSRTDARITEPTPARLRAQELAAVWRSAQAAARLAEERNRLRGSLAGLPRTTGPSLLLTGADSAERAAQSGIAAELDTVWHRLRLSETKIAVGFVIDLAAASPQTAIPLEEQWVAAYLLPDSTDRTVCIVRIPVRSYWRRALFGLRSPAVTEQTRQWLRSNLGPCAFFAAFGAPGRGVRQWLDHRRFDLALSPNWDADTPQHPDQWPYLGPGGDRGIWWEYIYHQSTPAVACMAGRSASCRDAVLAGATTGGGRPALRFLQTDRDFWRSQRLIGSAHYLSDIVSEVGRARFLEFWNSSLPVDTALARALRRPVGDWTMDWQQRFAPRVSLGPSVSLTASVLAVLFAAGAVACVALTVRRRQVLLLVIGVGVIPGTVSAQENRWERQVRTQLDRTMASLQRSVSVLRVAELNHDETATVMVTLKAGEPYDFVASCDEDCDSLHLRLRNASGSDMAVDRSGANLPHLRFTPSQSGRYQVAVTMAGCRMNPCWYGTAMSLP